MYKTEPFCSASVCKIAIKWMAKEARLGWVLGVVGVGVGCPPLITYIGVPSLWNRRPTSFYTTQSLNLLDMTLVVGKKKWHWRQTHYSYKCYHYNDVIMALQITSLTIVYSSVYSGGVKESIKAPRQWLLCGEFTGDRWIPRTKGQ